MTKQEEIREHLTELFEQTMIGESPDKLADAVIWVLNEDGVVIKVDKELPTFYTSKMPTCERGLECSFVEPLIEEGK